MAKIVKEVSVRVRGDSIRVLGFSSSDRGSKFVNRAVEIDPKGLSKEGVLIEIEKAVGTILGPQLNRVTFGIDEEGVGG